MFTGQLRQSHSSPSRKVSGEVSLYVGVFSAHCTHEMSSQPTLKSGEHSLYFITFLFVSLSSYSFVLLMPSGSRFLSSGTDSLTNSDCVQHAPVLMYG